MRGLGADAPPAPERGATATEIARTVASAAAHHLWTPTCLPRALATWRLCATRGIDARLRIGVRKEPGSLAAHAWIEVRGVPIGEPAGIETRYLPLVDPAPAPPGDAGRA